MVQENIVVCLEKVGETTYIIEGEEVEHTSSKTSYPDGTTLEADIQDNNQLEIRYLYRCDRIQSNNDGRLESIRGQKRGNRPITCPT